MLIFGKVHTSASLYNGSSPSRSSAPALETESSLGSLAGLTGPLINYLCWLVANLRLAQLVSSDLFEHGQERLHSWITHRRYEKRAILLELKVTKTQNAILVFKGWVAPENPKAAVYPVVHTIQTGILRQLFAEGYPIYRMKCRRL